MASKLISPAFNLHSQCLSPMPSATEDTTRENASHLGAHIPASPSHVRPAELHCRAEVPGGEVRRNDSPTSPEAATRPGSDHDYHFQVPCPPTSGPTPPASLPPSFTISLSSNGWGHNRSSQSSTLFLTHHLNN